MRLSTMLSQAETKAVRAAKSVRDAAIVHSVAARHAFSMYRGIVKAVKQERKS